MEDSGIQPSSRMYGDIIFFAQRSAGVKHAGLIVDRVGKQILILLPCYISVVAHCVGLTFYLSLF